MLFVHIIELKMNATFYECIFQLYSYSLEYIDIPKLTTKQKKGSSVFKLFQIISSQSSNVVRYVLRMHPCHTPGVQTCKLHRVLAIGHPIGDGGQIENSRSDSNYLRVGAFKGAQPQEAMGICLHRTGARTSQATGSRS